MGPKTGNLDRIDAEETLEAEEDASVASPTVEATRAQIEDTRAEMSETIDAIRDKLSSQSLKEQAKETVHEITTNVMEKAKASVHDMVDHAKTSVHDALHEAKENLPGMTANVAHQAVAGAKDAAMHAVEGAAGTAKQAGVTLMDAIRHNPVPAALIALGVGWLWASNRGSHSQRSEGETRRYHSPYDESSWGATSASPAREVPQYGASMEPTSTSENGPGVGATISQVTNRAKEGAGDLAGRVSGSVSHAAGRVGDTVSHAGARAGDYARGMASSCQTMLDERPLALGAIALGVGAAIGLLVPGSERENRLMGEMRDQLVGKVSEGAQEIAHRAQVVAEEAIDTAKEEARTQGLAG